MLKEIIKKYGNFSDALIYNFTFKSKLNSTFNSETIEIVLKCMNNEMAFKWEIVKLRFIGVISFRFIQKMNTSSTAINSVLLNKQEDIIIADFFPNIFGMGRLEANIDSDLAICCLSIEHEVLSESD